MTSIKVKSIKTMPIRRKDRTFDAILDEIDFDNVPIAYIRQINLILEGNMVVKIDQNALKNVKDMDNLMASASLEPYVDRIRDVEILIDNDKLKKDVTTSLKPLLSKWFKE
tara:strand:- start:823 stop:1155 length:333 start_codon:yes stop_codon:yes gene_type:complete